MIVFIRSGLWKLLFSATVCASVAFSMDIELNVETPVYVKRALVVNLNDFDLVNLERLAHEFIRNIGKTAFGVLYVTPDSDSWRYYISQGATGVSFEDWADRLKAALKEGWEPLPNIAEVNVIAGKAVLRMRRSGKVQKVLLTSQDPLRFDTAKTGLEILEFQGLLNRRNQADSHEDENIRCRDCLQSLHVFMRASSQIDVSRITRISQHLATLAKPADLTVHVRCDPWFIGDLWFPMLYAFDASFSLPTYDQFKQSQWATIEIEGQTGQVRLYGSHGDQGFD